MNIWLKTALIALMLIPIAGSAEWLIYDNNQPLGERYHENQDDGYGVKFVPDDPPGFIMVMKAYIGR
ncbi:MAG: hypothetical protein GY771_00555, partial [bacterium]|nr:hypothetical protein [bacterium]